MCRKELQQKAVGTNVASNIIFAFIAFAKNNIISFKNITYLFQFGEYHMFYLLVCLGDKVDGAFEVDAFLVKWKCGGDDVS
jgi:hypothetical protein